MDRLIFVLFCFVFKSFWAVSSFAQPGCDDPQALNFSPTAASNDGSCQYAPTAQPLTKKAVLPAELYESSGLVWAAGQLWSHNDSGEQPQLFAIDTATGQILKAVFLKGAANNDWEDAAFDGEHFFVGDFGNNVSGNRTDLAVYKIPLAKMSDTVEASFVQKIAFKWPDQTDFTAQPVNSTPFDCESMIWRDGALHLFTKNWAASVTAHYRLDPSSGACEKIETFPFASGLITAADVSSDGKKILLLGYDLAQLQSFVWCLWDFEGDQFFSGNKRKIALGSMLSVGKTEGIAFVPGSFRAFVSNERIAQFVTVPEQLHAVDLSRFFENAVSSSEAAIKPSSFDIWPVPFSQSLDFQCFNCGQAVLKDSFGRVVSVLEGSSGRFGAVGLPPGLYIVEGQLDGFAFRKKALKTGR